MSDTTELEIDVMVDPVTGEIIDEKKLALQLLEQSKAQGVGLIGPGGLLSGLTKTVLETALEAELTEHLGHEHGQTPMGANMRNGVRPKTVLTEIGPVQIEVPRDRDGSFEPVIVPKRKRRLDGIDQIVLSLTARGLTTGEIAAHFCDVYGATVSKDTISRITEKVAGEMAEWASRPLDRVYPVIFVDALVVKVRDGQVRNTPFYVVMGVTVNGERDILGIWAGGDGGEGARFWLQVFTELKNRGVEDVLIAVCDGLKGLPEAITTTWEHTIVQHRAPDSGVVPLRRPAAPRRDRQVAQAGLHRPVGGCREGPLRRVRRRVGAALPGDRAALGILVGGVRAVPRVRRGSASGDRDDQRDRVDQCAIPAGRQSPRALPRRGVRPEVPLPRHPLT